MVRCACRFAMSVYCGRPFCPAQYRSSRFIIASMLTWYCVRVVAVVPDADQPDGRVEARGEGVRRGQGRLLGGLVAGELVVDGEGHEHLEAEVGVVVRRLRRQRRLPALGAVAPHRVLRALEDPPERRRQEAGGPVLGVLGQPGAVRVGAHRVGGRREPVGRGGQARVREREDGAGRVGGGGRVACRGDRCLARCGRGRGRRRRAAPGDGHRHERGGHQPLPHGLPACSHREPPGSPAAADLTAAVRAQDADSRPHQHRQVAQPASGERSWSCAADRGAGMLAMTAARRRARTTAAARSASTRQPATVCWSLVPLRAIDTSGVTIHAPAPAPAPAAPTTPTMARTPTTSPDVSPTLPRWNVLDGSRSAAVRR